MKRIPLSEFKFNFSKSSGAGGQNINKVNTKVTLYWDIEASKSCSLAMKKRFSEKYKRYLVDGSVVIRSQRYRVQARNIEDCVDKLHKLLMSVKSPPKKRKLTKPTKSSVKKRLDGKQKHSSKKRLRSEKF